MVSKIYKLICYDKKFFSGYSVEFRAYNDGLAYRFGTSFKGEIMVSNEISELAFPEGSHSWYPLETSFMSHYERIFIYSSPDTIGVNHLAPGGGWAARIVPK